MQTLKTSKSRENILARIRKGLSGKSLPMPFPEADKQPIGNAIAGSELSLEETFADSFIKLGGKFVFCDNEQELLDNIFSLYESREWAQLLCAEERLLHLFENNKMNMVQPADPNQDKANACITGCELLVARTGSVFLSSKLNMGRTSSVFYPVHIIVAYAGQVVADIQDGLDALKEKYGAALPSMINLNTGPSRTADIEKTLVVGVHGPGEVLVFFVNA
jgi:L-lactate dehydrogenase complex protein LldG